MKNPVISITVFGVYLLATGLGFVLIPNLLLPLFGFPATTEVWVRIVGLLSAILGSIFFILRAPTSGASCKPPCMPGSSSSRV